MELVRLLHHRGTDSVKVLENVASVEGNTLLINLQENM